MSTHILGRGFKVRRITEGNHSSPEPPFDENWSLLTKLRWHAALATLDSGTGVEIRVRAGQLASKPRWGGRWITHDDVFSINIGRSSLSPMDFETAWTFITALGIGLREGREDDRR